MIENMLTISMQHISEETSKWLSNQAELTKIGSTTLFPSMIIYSKDEYGFFIPIYNDLPKNVPRDLMLLIDYATQKKCVWIHIDRDAHVLEDLQVYEW